MHEMSIAQSILDIVREEMARHQVRKLEAINVAVGRLSAVVPSSLSFCFKILTDATDLSEVQLKIREVPLGYSCFECGHEFTAEEMTFVCPHCGADGPRLTAGRDMNIESIEVAE
ncbi:MAG: hydrogenase maturation nickel metallochaperone HypA [Thermodesulfobacteriota bacterium]